MSQELIIAIKERITAGVTKTDIKAEVMAQGYEEAVFEAAYTLALHEEKGVSQQEVTLPSVFVLISHGVRYAATSFTQVVLIAVPLLFLTLFSLLGESVIDNPLQEGAVLSGILVSTIFYAIHLMAVLYGISQKSASVVPPYRDSLRWVRSNFFSLAWVYILTLLVSFGGFLFFIIPGFIVLVSVYFSQYVFVVEGKKGMQALLRSRALVQGRWWTVALKLFGVLVCLIIPMAIISVLSTMFFEAMGTLQAEIAGIILSQILAAIMAVIGMHIMFELYEALSKKSVEDVKSSARYFYWVSVLAGVVLVGGLFLFGAYMSASGLERLSSMEAESAAQAELTAAHLAARLFEGEQGTYTGVCAVIQSNLSQYDEVVCNENETTWALMVRAEDERWCTDATSLAKRISRDIGSDTACFAVTVPSQE